MDKQVWNKGILFWVVILVFLLATCPAGQTARRRRGRISGLFQGKFGVILGVNRHRSMGFLFIPADGKISRIYPARHLSCRTDGSLKGGVKI
jgi:hypothetical protein